MNERIRTYICMHACINTYVCLFVHVLYVHVNLTSLLPTEQAEPGHRGQAGGAHEEQQAAHDDRVGRHRPHQRPQRRIQQEDQARIRQVHRRDPAELGERHGRVSLRRAGRPADCLYVCTVCIVARVHKIKPMLL